MANMTVKILSLFIIPFIRYICFIFPILTVQIKLYTTATLYGFNFKTNLNMKLKLCQDLDFKNPLGI